MKSAMRRAKWVVVFVVVLSAVCVYADGGGLSKEMIEKISKYKIISINTLHDKLKDDKLAIEEAPKYGHPSLNFSFEIVNLNYV